MQQKVNEQTFKGQSVYVGIDVHKKDFKASVMVGDVFYKTFASPPEASAIVKFLHTNFPGADYYSAYEAGFSGFWLHRALERLGVKSIVVNPSDIPTTDKERQQKEDLRDSRKIVNGLRLGQLKPIYVPSVQAHQDRSLLRVRDRIVRDITRNKNRIKSLLYFEGIEFPARFACTKKHWSMAFTAWLESIPFQFDSGKYALQAYLEEVRDLRRLLLKLNRQIRELSRTPHYQTNLNFLISVPGIGPLTAMKLLTELDAMERFESLDHLCSYVGLVPATCSSGESRVDRGITRRRNKSLRGALIESAWVAVRNDPALLASYQKHRKSMDKNKAIVRVAKKLLNRVRHVLLKKEKYEKAVVK